MNIMQTSGSQTSNSQWLQVSRDGSAMLLTLSRPERANAYTQEMLKSLEEQIELADADASLRVIVITGAGERAFCGGADRTEIATRDWHSVLNLTSARVFNRLRKSRCVTIAKINGSAVGGGLELALSCDLRLAATGAKFWLPEPELGLIPAAGGTELLPLIVGPARAKEMILGGAVWNATEALHFGLLTEVSPPEELGNRVNHWIDRIGMRNADALRFAKQAIDLAISGTVGTGQELIAQAALVQAQRRKTAKT